MCCARRLARACFVGAFSTTLLVSLAIGQEQGGGPSSPKSLATTAEKSSASDASSPSSGPRTDPQILRTGGVQPLETSVVPSTPLPLPPLEGPAGPAPTLTPAPPLAGGGTQVSGGEAVTRGTTDAGDLIGKSLGGLGIELQRRNPIVTDPRVRGYQLGQVVTTTDGAFFFPARPDLDTIVSRIDSSLIGNIVILRGPYTVRQGPGFSFIDIETIGTPRSKGCFEAGGSTAIMYHTNGDGWNARQAVWGGGSDWGYRIGWDVLAASDYETGNNFTLPSSYNSQNFDFALGMDLTDKLGLEFKYFRQQQRDVEYAGALTDITRLVSDALNLRLVFKENECFRSTLDSWFNETRFYGNNLSPGKRAQIPQLDDLGGGTRVGNVFIPPGAGLTLNLLTNGDNNSWGFRHAMTFGRDQEPQFTAGWDFRYTSQAFNEFDTFFFRGVPGEVSFNFPLPRSRAIDPGLFLDLTLPMNDRFTFKAGSRVDFINASMQQPLTIPQPPASFTPPPNAPVNTTVDAGSITADLGPGALSTRHFDLWSAFGTADYKLTEELTVRAGYGYAQRPPTLVELYADGPFLALLQNGGTFVFGRGDPGMKSERLNQIDLGVTADYEDFRAGVSGFYSWIQNYITYDPVLNQNLVVPGLQGFRFKNTTMATLAGFELYAEYDILDWLTPFFTLTYVEGRDLQIQQPLPGIYPLDSRLGFRIHQPGKRPRWAVEFTTRMVAEQDAVASSLNEAPTHGFTVFDLRSYWKLTDSLLVTAGVENIGDRFYQEHFDLRTGINGGVFRPGVNFYLGMKMTY